MRGRAEGFLAVCSPPSTLPAPSSRDPGHPPTPGLCRQRCPFPWHPPTPAEGEPGQVCRTTKPEQQVLLGFPGAKRETIVIRRPTVNGIKGVFNMERRS